MPFELYDSERFYMVQTQYFWDHDLKKHIGRTFMFKPYFGKPYDAEDLEMEERHRAKIFELNKDNESWTDHGFL